MLTCCIPPPELNADVDCLRPSYRGIFVLNEGVWTQNNSSLQFLDEAKGYMSCHNIFEEVNGQPMGDTGNSMVRSGNFLFIIMNQSRRVYKLSLPSCKLLATLGLPESSSPREMVIVHTTKAYLTSLTDSSLYILNPENMTLSGSIKVQNHMEGIALAGGKAWVSCGSYIFPSINNKIACINTDADTVERYIELPVENPGQILANGDTLFVLCRGSLDPSGAMPAIYPVNALTGQTGSPVLSGTDIYGMEIAHGKLWVLEHSGVRSFHAGTLSELPGRIDRKQITGDALDLLYGIWFDVEKSELYVCNARFGGVNGDCVAFDPFGNSLRHIETGIYPGQLIFFR